MLSILETFSDFYQNTKKNIGKVKDHLEKNKDYYLFGGGLLAGAAGLNHWLGANGQGNVQQQVSQPNNTVPPQNVHGDPVAIQKQIFNR